MQLIKHYFPDLSELQLTRFESLFEVYKYWNSKINVISRKDIDELYLRHVLHSLSIAKFISFRNGARVLDVGTGGGFPGIPLSIFYPEVEFLLIDSIGKKVHVVEEVAKEIGLTNCKARQVRAEKVSGKFDFVVSRAVAPLPKLHSWVRNSIAKKSLHAKPNGIICLKGGDLSAELEPFDGWYTTQNIAQYFKEEFFETKMVVHLFSQLNR